MATCSLAVAYLHTGHPTVDFPSLKSLVAIQQRMREEIANNRFELLLVYIDFNTAIQYTVNVKIFAGNQFCGRGTYTYR